jgi:hypothetical protein
LAQAELELSKVKMQQQLDAKQGEIDDQQQTIVEL